MRRLRSALGRLRSLVGRGPAMPGRLRRILRPLGRVTGEALGLVPALLAGAGVFLVVAGLFYYLQPVAAAPNDTSIPAPPSGAPYTLPPRVSTGPSAGASAVLAAATRIAIPALGVDLSVIASPPHEEFPLCNVAEYMIIDKALGYPGLPQATYLFAHARLGMFLPLLVQSKINNGDGMKGMWVEVYTNDNQRHVYQISKVVRHVPDNFSAFEAPLAAKADQLWLQTSEGPIGFPDKLQVVADPIGVLPANPADAHPGGKGAVCPKAPKCTTALGTGCTR